MKRFYVLFATLLALNVCGPPVMYAQEGDVVPVDADQVPDDAEAADAVVIIDIHLASAIRSTLGLATDATLTATDMLDLRNLEAKKAEISDLRGLEHATNLTTLNLYGNQLTNISPLSRLEGLLSLDLGKNTITDIEALKGLTDLTTLHLDRNRVTDFSPLSSLTDLGVLHLSRTGIRDLSALGSLTQLTQLYLTGNAISDIGALSTLTEMGWLFLAQNQISNVSPLADMEALVSLRLLENPVSNASVLYGLTQGSLIDVDIEILPPADTEPPSVTIAVPADTQNGAFEVVITFTESVSGFEQADITLSGTATASLTAWSTTDDTVFTATLTPTTSGDVVVSVIADVATDAAGNNNTASDSQTVTVDMTPPEVSISVPEGVQNTAFDVVITFTEVVSGFEQADLSVSGTAAATVTAWSTTDEATYTATITPTTSGDVVVSVIADVATDAAGNNNTASDSQTVTVDMMPPEVSISVPTGVQNSAFDVVITFTERVSGFEQADFTLSGTATASITAWSTTDDRVWTATLTPTTSGTLTLRIAEGAVTDTVGNPNVLSTAEVVITLNVPDDTASVFVSVCDRTPQVRDAIVEAVSGVSDCADVTAADLATITLIDLRRENITALKEDDFNGLTALEEIHLYNNKLSSLPAGIFDGLIALKSLNLSLNDLSSLPAGIFDELTALEYLDLDYNTLRSLPAGIFDELTALETLELHNNKLSSLPAGIFDKLTVLKYLRLSANELSNLPAGIFDELTALEYLRLDLNKLSSLPAGIFDKLTALETLRLSGTDLSNLPAGIFDELTALEHLSLPGNDLSSLPEGIFDKLTALEYLNLVSSDLNSLPEGIFDELTALENLKLANNDLSSLPEGIFDKLIALKWLDLSSNRLNSLPAGIFNGLTALKGLDLSNNPGDPLRVKVSLKEVGEGEFKATARTGAPFDIVLPLVVTNGSIEDGGTLRITISTGTVESESVTVTRTPGTVDAVSVDIGTLPFPPGGIYEAHLGFRLVKSRDLPLTVIEGLGNAAPSIAAVVVLPEETTLSANYPNPFNPETWIPYQLANPSDVVISIYDGRGMVVRRLELGHLPPGYYTSRSRAAYWDGRNNLGEKVASGIYFYQFRADNVSLLRKMLILK